MRRPSSVPVLRRVDSEAGHRVQVAIHASRVPGLPLWRDWVVRCHSRSMLFRLLFRILSGEPYRKATPTELRWYSGAFALLPLWLVLFVHVGHSYLDGAGGVGIWLYMMGCVGVAALCTFVWARLIPASVSWIVAVVFWVVTVGLAFAGRLL